MLKVKSYTIETDHGLGEIERQILILKDKPYVKIGVLEKAGQHEGSDQASTTVAMIASAHEFGSDKRSIPERSFIRSTMNEQASHLNEMTDKLVDGIYAGKATVEKVMGILGLEIQRLIKLKIQSNIAPALKDATIRRKNSSLIRKSKETVRALDKKVKRGGELSDYDQERGNKAMGMIETGGKSTALIDTGQLINSIQFQTVMDGKISGDDGDIEL